MKGHYLFRYLVVESKMYFREWQNLFFVFLFPLMIVVLFGGIYGNTRIPGVQDFGYMDTAISGYVALVLLVSGMLNFPIKLGQYRERPIYRSWALTPLSPIKIELCSLVVSVAMSLVAIAVMLAVAVVAFKVQLPNLALLSVGLVTGMVPIYVFAWVVVSLFRRFRTANLVLFVLFFAMMFLSGVAIPLAVMGDSIRLVAPWLFLYYVVDLLNQVWRTNAFPWLGMDTLVLAGVTLAGGAVLALRRNKGIDYVQRG
jgi:ABC-2 type transport system permease protein